MHNNISKRPYLHQYMTFYFDHVIRTQSAHFKKKASEKERVAHHNKS